MKRVVVTGMGIVSSIGNSAQEVLASLREAKSGIVKAETYAELGFRCQVHGAPKLDWEGMIDRKVRRFMGEGAAWNYLQVGQWDAWIDDPRLPHYNHHVRVDPKDVPPWFESQRMRLGAAKDSDDDAGLGA